jgi:hypothetical protein
MKPQPPQEITPDHWISPPFFKTAGTETPDTVSSANENAAKQINAHKDNFVRICLESLFDDEEVGMVMLQHHNQPEAYIPALISKLDPAKLKLTLRNDMSPTIILPSHYNPNGKKQKGLARQDGHTLTMYYDNSWIGTMTIKYNLDGTISIDVTTKEKE